MKKYEIIEKHSGTNGDYVVKVYTDSFIQAVNILSKYHNPFGSDIKSSTLSMMLCDKYVVIGVQECQRTNSVVRKKKIRIPARMISD